jgi:predicted dehydrogenase
MAKLRIGVVGAGMISRHHLAAWRRIPEVDVRAICDPDTARVQSRAHEFVIPAVYGNAVEMLERESLDAVDIASPRELHAEHVLLAADRGLAVLCQKPLTPTYFEALDLVERVGSRSRLMVHENWRFRPYYRRLKLWLVEGRIGSVRSLRIVVRGSGFLKDETGISPALARQPFMKNVPRLAISESLIHQIDVARWLAGPLQLLAACTSRSSDQLAGEDSALIVMATQQGTTVCVDGDFSATGYPPRATETCEIVGTKATALLQDYRLQLLGQPSSAEVFDRDQSYQESFDACIGHFVACLLNSESFETSPMDNLETLKLVEDAYIASALNNS